MRCSSSEPLLAEYVDGTLGARRMADVARHVHGCASCAALVEELKVVDALLATATPAELPANFTFAVMAHVRSMPAPRPRRIAVWLAAAGYLAAAWLLAGGWFLARGTGAFAALGRIAAPAGSLWDALGSAFAGAAHAIAPNALAVGSILAVVLTLDLLALAALVYFYRSVRPRLLAAVTLEARR